MLWLLYHSFLSLTTNSNNGYTSHLCMGKRLLGFFHISKLFRQMNRRLMQKPYETDAYVVFLLFKLGLRIGEAVALKWSDIVWEAREIHIHRMESRVEGENGKLKVRSIIVSVLSADVQESK